LSIPSREDKDEDDDCDEEGEDEEDEDEKEELMIFKESSPFKSFNPLRLMFILSFDSGFKIFDFFVVILLLSFSFWRLASTSSRDFPALVVFSVTEIDLLFSLEDDEDDDEDDED